MRGHSPSQTGTSRHTDTHAAAPEGEWRQSGHVWMPASTRRLVDVFQKPPVHGPIPAAPELRRTIRPEHVLGREQRRRGPRQAPQGRVGVEGPNRRCTEARLISPRVRARTNTGANRLGILRPRGPTPGTSLPHSGPHPAHVASRTLDAMTIRNPGHAPGVISQGRPVVFQSQPARPARVNVQVPHMQDEDHWRHGHRTTDRRAVSRQRKPAAQHQHTQQNESHTAWPRPQCACEEEQDRRCISDQDCLERAKGITLRNSVY